MSTIPNGLLFVSEKAVNIEGILEYSYSAEADVCQLDSGHTSTLNFTNSSHICREFEGSNDWYVVY